MQSSDNTRQIAHNARFDIAMNRQLCRRPTRFSQRFREILAVAVVGLSVLTVACSPDATIAPIPNGADDATVLAADQQVARSIALALYDPGVRGQVRDAMRASLVDDHKLVLQEFVKTPRGKAMLQAAARRSGSPVAGIEAQIAVLPPLDFYMPIEAHRQSWRGTDDILVVATLTRKGPFFGYATTGNAISLAGRTRDQLQPLFMLHPSEPAGLRVNAQPATQGAVIQDPNDGPASERITWTPAGGTTLTVDFAAPNVAQQLTTLNAAIAAAGKRSLLATPRWTANLSGPIDTTRVENYLLNFCDDEACISSNEIRITAVYRNAAGGELARATYSRGGAYFNTYYQPNAPVIFQRIIEGTGQYMLMNLVEEDGAWGGNDDWCGDINVYAQHNGQTVQYPSDSQGCTAHPEYYPSAEVTYGWTPKPYVDPPPPPPPFFTVTINGPTEAQVGCAGGWLALASGGVAPYTYSWTVNGTPVDTGGSESLNYTPTTTETLSLQVMVTDSNGQGTGNGRNVPVTSGNCT
jgi:hypothetical protein